MTPGSSAVSATSDAYTDQSSLAQNKGTDSLYVKSESGSKNQRALVGFALPTVPALCAVTSATLLVYNSSPVSGRMIDDYQAAATWAEGTVTWVTQPGTTGTDVGTVPTATAGL